MKVDQKAFCEKYGIAQKTLEELAVNWPELEKIAADHSSRTKELAGTAQFIVGRLGACLAVHSLRWRVKEPEHLVEKIIRKRKEEPGRVVSLENYRTEITDLVGVRALHLFKSEWRTIHEEILKTWNLVDGHQATAYIREGDPEDEAFKKLGCKVETHKRGYRSVHYDVQLTPTKDLAIAEIQVRTLFEEGWSEIDHRVAYPNNTDDPLLTGYLQIFNLLAGASDQMATYLGHLKAEVDKLKRDASEKDIEARKAIQALEKIQKELGVERKEKKELERIVEQLKRNTANTSNTLGTLGDIFRSTSSSSGVTVDLNTLNKSGLFSHIFAPLCEICHKPLPPKQGVLSVGKCPHCGTPY